MSGFLLINKPKGITSHDVIDRLRQITSVKKIGHAGTLDPFATGLLIVAISREATKELVKLVKLDKEYLATLKLGAISDTYDRTGKIQITNYKLLITKKESERVLKKFIGSQYQIPPMYSAKKIKGKKLYELARQGKVIQRKPQKIKIYEIELLTSKGLQVTGNKKLEVTSYQLPVIKIKVHCSSGTYIRSLTHDIGQVLQCGAYLEELERIKIGNFSLNKAIKLEKLNKDNWDKYIINL